MQATTTQAETPDFSRILQEGESVLWSEPRRQMMEPAVVYLLLGAVVLLAIYGMMVWESLSPGGLGKDDALYMLFIPGISLVSILLAVVVAMRNRRMVYVLTRQRASSYLFQRPAILLAILLGLLGYLLNGIRRRYFHRRR